MKSKLTPALYVHIPFCAHICSYCDFCHFIYQKRMVEDWLLAFSKELKERLIFKPQTIYIGGGTPTALNLQQLDAFLTLLDPFTYGQEYTIEINPETFDLEKAKCLSKHGINRASIGLQSVNQNELLILGRKHSYNDFLRTIDFLEMVGIDNYNIDLMYSFPTQTFNSFKETITKVLSLKAKHLSLYSLTVEKNTPFFYQRVKPFDEEKEADFYEYALNSFTQAGYEQYEVANFCKDGYRSLHNQVYWHYDDFLGLSLGASSKLGNIRSDNTHSLKDYLAGKWISKTIVLNKKEEMFEFIMMNLRLKEGFLISSFKKRYQEDITSIYSKAILEGLKREWLSIDSGYLRVNNREILNSVLLLFMD